MPLTLLSKYCASDIPAQVGYAEATSTPKRTTAITFEAGCDAREALVSGLRVPPPVTGRSRSAIRLCKSWRNDENALREGFQQNTEEIVIAPKMVYSSARRV